MNYKINIHAHSIFSDGYNSPVSMAHEAKRLGFSALVLTEHYYGYAYQDVGMTKEKIATYKRAISEAREVLPVIVGLEVPFNGQEILVFGGNSFDLIIRNGLPNEYDIQALKKAGAVFILCHPSEEFEKAVPFVDGFEKYNGENNMFPSDRSMNGLENKQQWFNSDAHAVENMKVCCNIVKTCIKSERDLVEFIKSGVSAELCINEHSVDEVTPIKEKTTTMPSYVKILFMEHFEHATPKLYDDKNSKSPIEIFSHGERMGGFPYICMENSVLNVIDKVYEKAYKDGQENRSFEIKKLLGMK